MIGTMNWAARAIWGMPPKMMMPDRIATPMPTMPAPMPKAPSTACAIELAWTALNTRPKATISATANSAASQGRPRPRAMYCAGPPRYIPSDPCTL